GSWAKWVGNDGDAWCALAIVAVDESSLSEPNRHDRRVIWRNGTEVDHERPAIGSRRHAGRGIVQAAQRQLANHRDVKDPGNLLKARHEIAPECTQADARAVVELRTRERQARGQDVRATEAWIDAVETSQ